MLHGGQDLRALTDAACSSAPTVVLITTTLATWGEIGRLLMARTAFGRASTFRAGWQAVGHFGAEVS
jgi:hypothetical protein